MHELQRVRSEDSEEDFGMEAFETETLVHNSTQNQKKANPVVIVAIASICTFFMTISPIIYLPAIPLIQDEFNATDFEMTLTIFSYTLTCGIFPLFHGQISDFFGRKIVLLSVLTAFFGATLIAGSSIGIWTLIIGRGVMGVFCSGFTTCCTSMIADVIPPEKRATALGRSMLLATLGNILGGPIAGLIADFFGWRATFYVLLILLAPVIVFIFIFVPETHLTRSNDVPFRINPIRPFQLILANPKIAMFAIPNALTFSAVLVLNSESSLLLDEYYQFSSFVIGILLMNVWIGAFFGSMVGPKLSDYIRSKRGRGGSLLLAAVSSIVVAIMVNIFGFLVPVTPYSFLLCIVIGFFNLTTRGIIFSYSTEDNRKETAAIVSGLVCFQFLLVSAELLIFSLLMNYVSPGITFSIITSVIFIFLIPAFFRIRNELISFTK